MLDSLIVRYGLLFVFAGTFVEGETVLVLAGFAAHRGYLHLPSVMAVACLGTMLGDQLWFWLGRWSGSRVLARRPSWQPRVARARAWIARHERSVIWSFRFVYGIRMFTPFALGMGGTRPSLFALLNAASAAVWSVAVGGAGYLLGTALQRLLGSLHEIEGVVFAGILLAGVLLGAWRAHRARRPPAGGSEPGR